MEAARLAFNPNEDIVPRRSPESGVQSEPPEQPKRRGHRVPCRNCHKFANMCLNDEGRFVCVRCGYVWTEAEMARVKLVE